MKIYRYAPFVFLILMTLFFSPMTPSRAGDTEDSSQYSVTNSFHQANGTSGCIVYYPAADSREVDGWIESVFDPDTGVNEKLPPNSRIGSKYSPDGTKVWFLNADGVRNLVDTNTNEVMMNMPAEISGIVLLREWSPSSDAVVLETSKNGRYDIHIVNNDGTVLTPLTDPSHFSPNPRWSPDGKKIVFSSFAVKGEKGEIKEGGIKIYDLTTGDVRNITNNRTDGHPVWSPDGNMIAFRAPQVVGGGIKIYDLKTGDVRDVTNNPSVRPIGWLPDGKRIAFYSHEHSTRGTYFVNLDGSNLTKVTNLDIYEPSWSPQGNQLVFESAIEDGEFYILVKDLSGGELTKVAEGIRPHWYSFPCSTILNKTEIPHILRHTQGNQSEIVIDGIGPFLSRVHLYWRSPDGLPILGQPGTELGTAEVDAEGNWVLEYVELMPGELEIVAVAEVDGRLSEESDPLKVVVPYAPEITTPISNDGETALIDFQGVISGKALAGSTIHLYQRTDSSSVTGEPHGKEIGTAVAGEDGGWVFKDIDLKVGAINSFVAIAEIDGLPSPPSESITIDFDIFTDHPISQASTYGAKYPMDDTFLEQAKELLGAEDTRDGASNAADMLKVIGYDANAYLNKGRNDALERLYNDAVFYFQGHGVNEGISFYTEENGWQDEGLGGIHINGRQFPLLDLVVLNACRTGEDVSHSNNILNAFRDAGAETVVGFNKSVWPTQANAWGEYFWWYTQDHSVSDAAYMAARDANREWWSPAAYLYGTHINEDAIIILGDRDFRLKTE